MRRFPAGLVPVAALALVWLLVAYWPHVRNEFFVLLGNRDEAGGWYGWWSGNAGGLQLLQWIALAVFLWYHHTCHEKPGCLRWGAYEVAGGLGKKCRKHHPDLRDHPREHHGQVLDRLHREWKERQP